MKISISFLLIIISLAGYCQELPPVINFDQNQYQAGNQNWMIAQATNKSIYVANSRGLLEYTGTEWNLYPVPNKSIVRSVEVLKDKIFTGAYMEFGYWEKQETGLLRYTSLVDKFPEPLKDGEQFWHIRQIENIIVLQSFEGLYLFNLRSEEISKIKTPSGLIRNLFKVENSVYFQIEGQGIYTVRNNAAYLVIPHKLLGEDEVMHIAQRENDLRIITRSGLFLRWTGEEIINDLKKVEEKLRNKSIFSALTFDDNAFLIGTVEDGIYYLAEDGEVLFQFNQQNGLINNTVLWLQQDVAGNIWAGLDNGLSIINIKSQFRLYQDIYGHVGSVYASHQSNDILYLGTNQGLFYRFSGENRFRFMEGTNGQVWSLQELDGIIFMGHNSGTFLINGTTAKKVFDKSGTWVVKKYENNPGVYIQGHYNGLSLLEAGGTGITFKGMIPDFPHSSKFVLSEPNGEIWVGNEHKGVYKIKLNGKEKPGILSIENYTFNDISGITSSIFKFNDTIYYSALDQLYQYRRGDNKFSSQNTLAALIRENDPISGKIINTAENLIWGFSGNSVFNIETVQLGDGYKVNAIYLPGDLKNITLGYENINRLSTNEYLIGVSNGYLKFERSMDYNFEHTLRIDKIYTSALDNEPQRMKLNEATDLHYKTNNINFTFSIAEYNKFLTPLYSYRLVGLSPNWSAWSTSAIANFENLGFGDYEFQIRGKLADNLINPVSYSFTILRPWYLSLWAILVYVIIFIILLFLVNKMYKMKHLKLIEENERELRLKNLESENTIIELQNEQLEKDMAGKNKELAISTMNLIKKNEFLTSLREQLKAANASREVQSVIKTIDKDISEKDNWKFFREAFNNADQDFFKKVKAGHPNLSSNDLKLCAYLRLNLSSKEIAALLNISGKSVEIKRYRLRKKMNLPHETNLVDYILEI